MTENKTTYENRKQTALLLDAIYDAQYQAKTTESAKKGVTGKVCIVCDTIPHNVWLSMKEMERLVGDRNVLETYGLVGDLMSRNLEAYLVALSKGDQKTANALKAKGTGPKGRAELLKVVFHRN